MGVRAFKSECVDVVSIVFAITPEQARHATVIAANEAGYGVKYADVRVTRWPEYDSARTAFGGPPVICKPLCVEHLRLPVADPQP